MSHRARMDSSDVVSYIKVAGVEPMPVYGCGKDWALLEMFYDMDQVNERRICRRWLRNNCTRSKSECRFEHRLPPRKRSSSKASKKVKRTVAISGFIAPKPGKGGLPQGSWAKRVHKDVMATGCSSSTCGKTPVSGLLQEQAMSSSNSSVTPLASDSPATDHTDMSVAVSESRVDTEVSVPAPPAARPTKAPMVSDMISTTFTHLVEPTKPPMQAEKAKHVDFETTPLDTQDMALSETYAPSYTSNVGSLSELSTSWTAPMHYGQTAIYQPKSYDSVAQPNVPSTFTPTGYSYGMRHAHQEELGKVQRELVLVTRREFEAKQAAQRAVSEKIQLQAYYNAKISELGAQVANLRAENVLYLNEIEGLRFRLLDERKVQKSLSVRPVQAVQPVLALHHCVSPSKPASDAMIGEEETTAVDVKVEAPEVSGAVASEVAVPVEQPVRQRRKRARRTNRTVLQGEAKATTPKPTASETKVPVLKAEEFPPLGNRRVHQARVLKVCGAGIAH